MGLLNTYTYEEGANGAAVVSGSNGVVAIAGSPVYSTAAAQHGSRGVSMPATVYIAYAAGAAGTMSFYTRIEATGAGSGQLCAVRNTNVYLARIRWNTSNGFIDITNQTSVVAATGTIPYVVGQSLRCDMSWSYAGGNITVTVKTFLGSNAEGTVPDEVIGPVTFASASTPNRVHIGHIATSPWVTSADSLRLYDSASDVPGPYGVVTPPAATVAHNWCGSPTTTGFTVVSKTSGAASVRLAVSSSSGMGSPTYTSAVTPDADGYARHTVTGLSANAKLYYQVAATPSGGTEALVGSVGAARTLKASGTPQTITAAFSSCSVNTATTRAAYDSIAAWDPAFFVHMGDFHYKGSTAADAATHAGFLAAQIAATPGLGTLLATVPTFYVNSDHEAGPDDGNSNTDYGAAFNLACKQVTPDTYVDTASTPASKHRSWTVGRVRFILLDIRNTARSDVAATDNATKTMLGATQKAWLKQELIKPELLKVIISDVPWMGAASSGTDKWWSYSTERQEIIDFIARHQVNVDMWHGDSHRVAAATATKNTWGAFPIICASGMDQNGGGAESGNANWDTYWNNSAGAIALYGRVTITDDGTTVTRVFSGWDAAAGTERVAQTVAWTGRKITVWNGTTEVPATVTVWDGAAEAAASFVLA